MFIMFQDYATPPLIVALNTYMPVIGDHKPVWIVCFFYQKCKVFDNFWPVHYSKSFDNSVFLH